MVVQKATNKFNGKYGIKEGINKDLEFQKMCTDSGYEWRYMKPTQDGRIIQSSQSCWGCMVEGIEHVCDMEKFMDLTGQK